MNWKLLWSWIKAILKGLAAGYVIWIGLFTQVLFGIFMIKNGVPMSLVNKFNYISTTLMLIYAINLFVNEFIEDKK